MINKQNQLINYLALHVQESKTIRQLSLETKIPYMTLNRLVKQLSKKNIILTQKIGKSFVSRLNLKSPLTKSYLTISSEEITQNYLKKQPLIKLVHKAIQKYKSNKFSAVLFGSYAKGTADKHSDIDLAFVSNNKTLLNPIEKELNTLEQLYNIEINYLIFTKKQFKEMLRAKEENVGRQIFKNHIILHNSELFWEVTLNAI